MYDSLGTKNNSLIVLVYFQTFVQKVEETEASEKEAFSAAALFRVTEVGVDHKERLLIPL